MPPCPGLQNPTVGSGAEYQMTTKGKDMDIAIVDLGKEDVDGDTGLLDGNAHEQRRDGRGDGHEDVDGRHRGTKRG